jgi:poly-gamma-glutamate synthesis protein (capsule biosynthesis protein)
MIRVAAVGDLMLGDSSITVGFGVRGRYPGARLGQLFAELAPRLKAADIAIGNLECALTPLGAGASRWARDQMRGDEAYARVLRDAGFTAIAVANNHAMQHGDAAFERTLRSLRAEGLLVLGVRGKAPWHGEPVTYAHNGASVAMLAYSSRPRQYGRGVPPYADVLEPAVLADVARARASHDSVIVSLHWGVEFVRQPSIAEVAFAHALVERGADLVIGHHPHVVRPLEVCGTSAIAYSLGNCITDMIWLDQLREGALLEASLSPRPADIRVTRMRVDDDYRVRIGERSLGQGDWCPEPLDARAYDAASAAGERRQRAASYEYLVRNVFRYPPPVLGALIGATVSNKWKAAVRRLRGAGP